MLQQRSALKAIAETFRRSCRNWINVKHSMLIHGWLVTIPTAKAAQEERERHWGTLANKAFAVQDRIMWKGLQMIAIWKMASEQLGQLMLPISHVPHLLLWSAMGNERQTAEEWNFETWVLPGSERWLAPGAQLQGTKELANVDPHLAPQLHHVRNQVHQSWPTFVAWKFWSQHPSGWYSHFSFVCENRGIAWNCAKKSYALQPKPQRLTPW